MDRSPEGFLAFAVTHMYQKRAAKIRCPCSKCKNDVMYEPFNGTVLAHLLANKFMPGYTRWTLHGEEEDVVADEEGGNNGKDPKEGGNEGGYEGGNEEMPEHDHEEDEHEPEEAQGTQESSLLASMVGNPHYKELFWKKTSTERAASKETAKLAQLEKDAKTPLYVGCNPKHTRLDVTLNLLDLKAQFKCNDVFFDKQLEYLSWGLPRHTTRGST